MMGVVLIGFNRGDNSIIAPHEDQIMELYCVEVIVCNKSNLIVLVSHSKETNYDLLSIL